VSTITRRDLLRAVGLGAAATVSPRPLRAAAKDDRPNIIYIMADDLGYGHLGCYGQEKIRTPRIDRMAADGLKFTQYYAGYTVCAPSRSVLMTGLHHGHTPVRTNGSTSLLADEVTVAQVLQKAGYSTGGFGKWGLGVQGSPGQPNKKGFDEFYGLYHQVHGHFYYPYWIWHNEEKMQLPGNVNKREQYVEDVLHGKVLDFIRTSAKKGQPFFCYVPSIVPHVELAVPEESIAPYRGKFPKATINDGRAGYIGSDDAYTVYAGMISRLDQHVGEVLDLVKELGIDKNTLVIFTSDNGPQGGPWQPLVDFFNGAGPLRGSKGSLTEGGIRVPFIARWPGTVAPGTSTEHIGGFQDMMPTFAELAGAECPKTDGISIAPTLRGQADRQKKHEYLYWGGKGVAIRMGKWKAYRSNRKDERRGKGTWRLYDLAKDVGESRDVAAKHADVVARLDKIVDEAFTPPRAQKFSKRAGIKDYVRGDRLGKKNAR